MHRGLRDEAYMMPRELAGVLQAMATFRPRSFLGPIRGNVPPCYDCEVNLLCGSKAITLCSSAETTSSTCFTSKFQRKGKRVVTTRL